MIAKSHLLYGQFEFIVVPTNLFLKVLIVPFSHKGAHAYEKETLNMLLFIKKKTQGVSMAFNWI